MPVRPRPQDCLIAKKDARLLERYADKIDPEGHGVSCGYPTCAPGPPSKCCVCDRKRTRAEAMEDWPKSETWRAFSIKPAERGGDYGRVWVCPECMEKAR